MNPVFIVLSILGILIICVLGFILIKKKRGKGGTASKKKNNINEWSYQRFAQFYGFYVFPDSQFQSKLDNIKKCIEEDKLESIEEIANKTGCTLEECVMKIRYLKNKRVLGDYAVDMLTHKIRMCSEEEKKLLEKYNSLVYEKHYQISEMANEVPNYHNMPIAILREDIYKDIKYLNDRLLLNGIKLNDYEKKIVYYTVEKHKKAETLDTLNCPTCGIIMDVAKGGQEKCPNCGCVLDNSKNN